MKIYYKILVIILAVCSCEIEKEKRETVIDNISHVEDSIHYLIDSIPRICDELNINKQYIDIGNCKLYCEIEGNGAPIVLINGGPGGTHHCFHPWFTKAAEFCKVIYYDQRGTGQSDFNQGDGYSFRQAVDDLDKLRQKLGIEKWIVCGYSYGGGVAQYYSATYPENVLGLILVGSITLLQNETLLETRQYNYISEEEMNKIRELYELYNKGNISFLQLLLNKDLNGDWKRQNFYKPTEDEFLRSALYEWVNDKDFNYIMTGSYSSYDFKNIFDNCPIPTLICEGKWDLTWNEEKKDIFKKNHPNAQYILFENSGHSIYNEESELFFSILEEFVIKLKPVPDRFIHNWKIHTTKLLIPQEILFKNEKHFLNTIFNEGIDKALNYYETFKSKNNVKMLFTENGMNDLGYYYLEKKEFGTAIKIFQLNVEAFPNSWNAYDSLGEAYLKNGNKEMAAENYKISIALNPDNTYGKKILDEITMSNKK